MSPARKTTETAAARLREPWPWPAVVASHAREDWPPPGWLNLSPHTDIAERGLASERAA